MGISKISKSDIKVLKVQGTLAAGVAQGQVTATVPSGYKFVCWVEVTSRGWLGLIYAADVDNPTSDIWRTDTSVDGSYDAWYLVSKI